MCGIALLVERVGALPRDSNDNDDHLGAMLQREIETRLRQRGPDHFACEERAVGTWRLHFCSAVLHLRGDALTPQPITDAAGNLLCWNGEVFGGLARTVGEHENDTRALADALLACVQPSDDPSEDTAATCTQRVIALLQRIEGPFAFVWFHAASQRAYFGHDRFGRRSLLYQPFMSRESTSMAGDNEYDTDDASTDVIKLLAEPVDASGAGTTASATTPSTLLSVAALERLCLSSVALTTQLGDRAAAFREVPSTGVYVLDLVAQTMAFHSFEPIVSPASLPSMETESSVLPRIADVYACGFPISLPDDHPPTAAHALLTVLSNAVGVRVRTIPSRPARTSHEDAAARVGVLFSGGLDSVVLAALAHAHVVDQHEPIDLLNVCFDVASQFQSPDRVAAEISLHELKALFPTRHWRLVRVNVPLSLVLAHQREVVALMAPCDTHMDFNIGAAFWWLARGEGQVTIEDGAMNHHDTQPKAVKPGGSVDLNAFLHGDRVSPAQLELEGAVRKLALFDNCANETKVDNDTTASSVCPVSRCGRKHKTGCTLGVCRVCCFRAQQMLAKLLAPSTDAREKQACRANLVAMLVTPLRGSHDEQAERFERVQQLERVCESSAVDSTVLCRVHRTKKSAIAETSTPASSASQSPATSEALAAKAYTSAARVLLVGIGADEQLGGYGRHRTAFRERGAAGLRAELARDMARIWKRNLGRDDRCISAHGREARFPFLDERVVRLLATLPLESVCDLAQQRGRGDKLVLREAARLLGLRNCAGLAKRAIQFGSRIAKQANALSGAGSNRQATGDAKFMLLREPLPHADGDDARQGDNTAP